MCGGLCALPPLAGTALVPYVMMGLFGAALWGQEACATGNLLQNSIFGASPAAMQAQAAINFCTAGVRVGSIHCSPASSTSQQAVLAASFALYKQLAAPTGPSSLASPLPHCAPT